MPAFYKIFWTKTFYAPAGYVYRLGEGDLLDMWTMPVWCEGCGEVTAGEDLRTVGYFEEEIRRWERVAGEIREEMKGIRKPEPGATGDRDVRERIGEMKRRLQWRARRKSAGRCTVCGGEGVEILTGESGTRVGGVEIVVKWCGFYEPMREDLVVFDSEGRRVRE